MLADELPTVTKLQFRWKLHEHKHYEKDSSGSLGWLYNYS